MKNWTSSTKEFLWEVKDILKEDAKDSLIFLKWVGKELSWKAQKQRDRFWQYY